MTVDGGVALSDVQAHDEYPCCHQLAGRPPTEYCPAPENHTQPNPLGMTFEATHHANGNDMHPRHECHPDRCGMWATTTVKAADHPGDWTATLIPGQPPTQTSQPTTQHRDPADLVGHLRDAVDQAKARRQADQVTEDNKGQRWHETGPDEAHETWRCSPSKCGRERTPLGTPTPGTCPTTPHSHRPHPDCPDCPGHCAEQ